MAVEAYLPTITTIAITAAIDSINPCAIGVLILMVSVMLSQKSSAKRMLLLGGLYIFSVFAVYLLAGFGLLYFLAGLPLALTEYIAIGVGILIIGAGILEIKDYFWYGKGPSLHIPANAASKIHEYSSNVTIPGVMLLGAFVSAVELPCTGAPYLAIITLLSQYGFNMAAFWMLVLYNIIFVAPLIIILFLVAGGKKVVDIKKWKQSNRAYMRLLIGLLLVAMGWLLMLIANGTINFG